MNDNTLRVIEVDINDVLPNRFQPRLQFEEEEILELSDSIKEHGVIQPLIVRQVGNKYEIIAGERRYKASVLAGKDTIPVIIKNLDDKESAEIALIENVQRKNLSPIEEAISYKKILDMGYLTQTTLALKLGKSQPAIANKIRLLNLSDEVQEALLENKISERHARSLLKISSIKQQNEMLDRIINERLTVRSTDEEIGKLLGSIDNIGDNEEERGESIDMDNNGLQTNTMPDMFITDPVATPQSTVEVPQMTVVNSVPTMDAPAPTVEVPQMPAADVQPTFEVPQMPAADVQPTFEVPQMPAADAQPTFEVPQMPAADAQPTFEVPQMPAVEPQPTFEVPQMPAADAQPTFEVPQVPTLDAQPTFEVPQIPAVEPQPVAEAEKDPVPLAEVQPANEERESKIVIKGLETLSPQGEPEQPATAPVVEPQTEMQPAFDLQIPITAPIEESTVVEPAPAPVAEPQMVTPPSPEVQVEPPVDVAAPQPEQPTIPEPIIITDYNKQYDPVMPQTEAPVVKKADLKEVINIIRACSKQVEQLGYSLELEEYDLQDMYQVIFKINKN